MNNSEYTFYEYIDHLIDKFNLKITITKDQLKSIFMNISHKAIMYELITSILTCICIILVFLILFIVYKKMKEKYDLNHTLKKLMNYYEVVDSNPEIKLQELIFWIILFISIICLVPIFITNIIDTISCALFPEKIILEFIGKYMS